MSLLTPLLRPSFWISFETQPFTPWVSNLMGVILLVLLVATLGVYFYPQPSKDKLVKQVRGRVLACLVSATLIGLVLYFMTWQMVPVLGMRAFWPIWFIAHITWGIWIYRDARKRFPEARQAQASRQAYEKWLPKPKK